MSSKVPQWYTKFMGNSRIPDWYGKLMEDMPPMTPDAINEELASGASARGQVERVAVKGIKLPGVGSGPKPSSVAAHSYFNQPINVDREIAGNSRRWGDIDEEAKKDVIGRITEHARAAGLDKEDTAYLLALVHFESGFNPDAAAGSTSAHGLGQFVNATGSGYGLNDSNRWDINEQIRALVDHFKDNKKLAGDRERDYIYAYHHDGPTLAYGGLNLAKTRVRPLFDMYRSVVN